MINWQKFSVVEVRKSLRLGFGAVIETVSAAGVVSTISIAEQAVLDGVTAGTVTASKAVVVDANKDISAFRDVTVRKLIGSTAPLNIDGLAAAQGGDVTVTGGTSSTGANAGGAVNLTGGTPGSTGVGGAVVITGAVGGSASGTGGAVTITAGAGTAGNASGGSVIISPGALQGSGITGGIFLRSSLSQVWRSQVAPVAKTGNDTITIAQMLTGLVQHTATTGVTLTTPTGAAMSAGAPASLAVGDSFDMTLQVVGVGADDIVTLTAGDGAVTFSGSITVGGADPAGGVGACGVFRFRNSGAGTWVGYRVS